MKYFALKYTLKTYGYVMSKILNENRSSYRQ